ncbi:MAG: type II toxin-antitoxin system HicB family antitoxin [Nitrococcus mobilis]|nr:type II toxin-antitoxin system HicB family antitoxin [Nitrococcus mobilis]
MKPMTYRGYAARIEYSDEDGCLVGRVAGIRDIISFHGESVCEMRDAFHEAVDDYLELCAQMNKQPQKPYSGNLFVRLAPELHAKAAMRAEAEGLSLNQWAAQALERALD